MNYHEFSPEEQAMFFHTNPNLFCITSREGYFAKVNAAWETTLGYTTADLTNKQFSEFVHPDDLQPTLAELDKFTQGATTLHFINRYRCKDGSHKHIEWHSTLRDNLIYSTARDISPCKNYEENIRQKYERILTIWESQNSYVLRTDLTGAYTFANQKYINDFGWVVGSDGILIGKQSLPSICATHHAATQATVAKCLAEPGKSFQVELDKPLQDGRILSTLWDFICLTDEQGNPTEMQCSGVNIAERKREEEERLRKQQFDILETATPITQLWEGILLLPLIGLMSAQRAQSIMMSVLRKISETQAKVFILDISGVAVVDTEVANHFLKLAKATRLMGCACTISGISPAVSQTIVELGIQIDELNTTGTMRDALERALALTGSQLVKK